MKCACDKVATIHITNIVEGHKTEDHYCVDCALLEFNGTPFANQLRRDTAQEAAFFEWWKKFDEKEHTKRMSRQLVARLAFREGVKYHGRTK